MKKYFKTSLLLVIILLISLTTTSCKKNKTKNYASSTVIGQITKISNNSVTLTLGKLNNSNQPNDVPKEPNGGNDMPPEMPGDNNGNQSEMPGTPPEKPDGMGPNNSGNEFVAGSVSLTVDFSSCALTKDQQNIDVSSLAINDIVSITFDENGVATTAYVVTERQNMPQNPNGKINQGTSANTITTNGTIENESYSSNSDDENALRIDNATVNFNNINVNKNSGASSNVENGDFYGVNAAVLATNNAIVSISKSIIKSAVKNGNGVFSYGSNTTVNINDTTITTTGDNSGGIQTTGGGITNAKNLTITTSGNSSAAIRSDRGGGTVMVDGGCYTTNGYNSPTIYSTALIDVKNATLIANNSEALVVEGKNSISLTNCTITGNMSDTLGSSSKINVHNIMLYQSMSGDATIGTSTLSLTNCILNGKNGDMIYVTNTIANINLCNSEITNEDSNAYLLRVTGNDASNGWGNVGENGGQVTLVASNQQLNGNMLVDSISTLDLTLKDNSNFTGTIELTTNGNTTFDNNVFVTIEEGSVWNLTGDVVISSLTNLGTINYNGYTITLANGTILGE